MPNHYHFLLHQTDDNGITEFMHKLNTSYTMYFNLNLKRTGRLFEYTFKAKHISQDEIFLHVVRYIHINPIVAGLVENLELWPWSSYLETIGRRDDTFCNTLPILEQFGHENPSNKYEKFVSQHLSYAKILHDAKRGNIEDGDAMYI
jgi:hypothetical protein